MPSDADSFARPGLYTCITAAWLTFILVCITTTYFYFQNRKAKEGKTIIEGLEGFSYTH